MPKKREILRVDVPTPRIKEDLELNHARETWVDFMRAAAAPRSFHTADPFMNVIASQFFDCEEEDEDEDHDPFHSRTAASSFLQPHPRIRQLTDEEADQHAAALKAEEEKRSERTERNKRKKMRKKEKKRLEKENLAKENLHGHEQGKPDCSENEKENLIIQSNNDTTEENKTENLPKAAECDEDSGENNSKEENNLETIKEEDKKEQELDFRNLYACSSELLSEEMSNQKISKFNKKEKNISKEALLHNEEKTKMNIKPEAPKEPEAVKEEKKVDLAADEITDRSRELAAAGNRLAASGQYLAAVECFTEAIKFNPTEIRLFGNRSLCYERLQQYENALRDAELALSMEPKWIKGLFRKGKALCGLKKYYDASLVYKEVLNLESSSTEAAQELKRAQTLHLMEMGFSWSQSNAALKTHPTLEEAVDALFRSGLSQAPEETESSRDTADQAAAYEEDDENGDWIFLRSHRPRTQQNSEAPLQNKLKYQSPGRNNWNSGKPDLISVWVGSLSPTVTYPALHELFSRVGVVYGVKMLLDKQCALVHYATKEDCDRAIQTLDGLLFEGCPLSVRHPSKGVSSYKKECFFWRTTGCTRDDCIFKHIPEHKNMDRNKFTGRLGQFKT
ncbi:uncharacterized protein LOC103382405 isoform X2 [Cynoglossus semilaevis]|uniref:uncharacterized protein LOC103382405 isoform X2 n=2 Tax=Cynoglossus semilaevis TaxID=244447 RepID=UPI00049790BC|nr:uncharacterized protein LOC103382405 isoform X2 [Cynoglossus semilaevis]